MGISSPAVRSEIHFRPGRLNSCADALSHAQLVVSGTNREGKTMVATIGTPQVQAKDSDLADRQGTDPQLGPIVQYLRDGILPPLEKEAKELVLNNDWYVLVDNIVYHIAMDGTLCIVPPVKDRKGLIQEAHVGKLAAHLWDAKIFGQLSRTYWWLGMRK